MGCATSISDYENNSHNIHLLSFSFLFQYVCLRDQGINTDFTLACLESVDKWISYFLHSDERCFWWIFSVTAYSDLILKYKCNFFYNLIINRCVLLFDIGFKRHLQHFRKVLETSLKHSLRPFGQSALFLNKKWNKLIKISQNISKGWWHIFFLRGFIVKCTQSVFHF